ncbi:TDP-N-acetylfucosamine:lipid II N-acetylfucosaminyltransferase [Clostridium sporogenes]|uniref:TDP-N-acetylfucosamine:lipid II N-acetylfucosaminyltransferase n=1 Tax=Clostridium sporogenes TaxID=1509 RepID=UPI0013C98B57|nr:TDP-N-acetylfucosamine:lipid II N-acetylfucosaminyltransferase [Clostridium sporogenes]NFF64914.1 hypothetical protein [Clostridium sporogenes]
MEKIILFGASKMGEAAYVLLKDKYEIIYFCDNDKNKCGTQLYGIEIISPQNLKVDEFKSIKILITSMYYKEIIRQLTNLGLGNFEIFKYNLVSAKEENHLQQKSTENKYIMDELFENKYKKIKHLHIMRDSFFNKRFIELINSNLRAEEHKFIIIENIDDDLKYMKDSLKYDNVKILYDGYFENKLYYYIKNSQAVYIHYLREYICEFISKYEVYKEVELNWVIWGGDVYAYTNIEMYDKHTREFLIKNNLYIDERLQNSEYRVKAIEKMDYILPPIYGDYEIIKENYKTNAQFKKFSYVYDIINYKTKGLKPIYNLKEKYKYVFLVGNSGYASSNHLDIIYKLKEIKNKDFCVLCPLAYGNKNYIEKLIKVSKDILGDRFIPLTNFMELEEYTSFLSQVDIAIMNHNRQQAVGNIILLLYLGKKVFLKKSVTTFSFLEKKGFEVFDIEDLVDDINSIEEIKLNSLKNQENVIKNFSNDKALEIYKEIF